MTVAEAREELKEVQERKALYLEQEKNILTGGTQSYNLGTRSASKYQTDLASIKNTIKELKARERELKQIVAGNSARKSKAVILRDW